MLFMFVTLHVCSSRFVGLGIFYCVRGCMSGCVHVLYVRVMISESNVVRDATLRVFVCGCVSAWVHVLCGCVSA